MWNSRWLLKITHTMVSIHSKIIIQRRNGHRAIIIQGTEIALDTSNPTHWNNAWRR